MKSLLVLLLLASSAHAQVFGGGSPVPATVSTLTVTNTLTAGAVNTSVGSTNSTMTSYGLIYAVDYSQIAGSTFTASATETAFSTWSYVAGMAKPGDTIVVECKCQNSGTLTGPQCSITSSQAGGAIVLATGATANGEHVKVEEELTMQAANNKMMPFPKCWYATVSQTVGSQTCGSNGWPNASGSAQLTDANQTLGCSAKVTSGGNVNFLSMKVYKR